MKINDRFESFMDDFCKFELVQNKRSGRSDVHAFMLLDELFPNEGRLVVVASSDEIILEIGDDEIESLRDSDILELVRCGVRYDSHRCGLMMFN